MFPVTSYAGREVAVFGLARTGIAAALALAAGGARVMAWDDGETARAAARAAGIEPVDLRAIDWSGVQALVMSPGVPIYGPRTHWTVDLAEAAGVPVIGDVELFAREINALPAASRPQVVAITGTNGKSTTTALIAHVLGACGRDVRMGGNIGVGILSLPPPRPGAVYVLELSSYQLDLSTSLRCDVAIQLNLSEDHLERHGTMARYAAAKRRIFANQQVADTAVVGVDDDWGDALCTRLITQGKQNVVPVSACQGLGRGVCALDHVLWDNLDGRATLALDLALAPGLPGRHNGQNAAAAYAAARALGLPREAVAAALQSFPGLRHRLQQVARLGSVRFFNDSKATNADAAAQALDAFGSVRWIAGGQPKSGGIDALSRFFPRVRRAYLIGEAGDAFAATLDGRVDAIVCGTLAAAVAAAWEDARASGEEEVILLSPACASFDQYPDFEARGDDFIARVQDIVNRERGLDHGGARTVATG